MSSVFFTGHRTTLFYAEDLFSISRLLNRFIEEGTVDFYAGDARGLGIYAYVTTTKKGGAAARVRLYVWLKKWARKLLTFTLSIQSNKKAGRTEPAGRFFIY